MTRPFRRCAAISACALALAGCGPTYPKERVTDAIVAICKKEYKTDVKAATVGKTIGIYLPLENLIDFTFAISKSASDRINDVILSVTRVCISTDAKFDFYVIVAHDVRIPEIQIVIIKSVEDVKRFLLTDISRGEYSKRMIVDMRLSPQAQKEKTIKSIFEKMKLDKKWQEEVLNDFFRIEPLEIGEIGYWNGRFYLKNITLAEFLAAQIASRIKLEFKDDKALAKMALVRSAKGLYKDRGNERAFEFQVTTLAKEQESSADELHVATLKKVLDIASYVFHSYRFAGFDFAEIADLRRDRVLRISREDLERYYQKKLKFDDIVKTESAP